MSDKRELAPRLVARGMPVEQARRQALHMATMLVPLIKERK